MRTPKQSFPSLSREGCKGGIVLKGLEAPEGLCFIWRADAHTHPYTPPLKGRGF